MNKFLTPIFLALIAIFFSVQVSAAELTARPNVAVLPFRNKAAIPKVIAMKDASLVSDFMIEQLLESGRFRVVEREELESAIKELSFGMSGILDPSASAQLGKMFGVNFLIAGSVAGLSTTESGAEYSHSEKGGAGVTKKAVVANITVRFIDVETGEIVMAVSGTGKSSRASAELSLKKKYYEDYETTTESEYGIEEISDEKEVRFVEQKITIGSDKFSQVQVRNALYKAAIDAIFNKNYGIIAKLDGRAKRRKV